MECEERAARAEADRETLAYAKLEDQISNAQLEDEMFASRLEQLEDSVSTAEEALAERIARADDIQVELTSARARAEELSREISRHSSELVAARQAEGEARTALSSAGTLPLEHHVVVVLDEVRARPVGGRQRDFAPLETPEPAVGLVAIQQMSPAR